MTVYRAPQVFLRCTAHRDTSVKPSCMLLCDGVVWEMALIFIFLFRGHACQFFLRCENCPYGLLAFLDLAWESVCRFLRRCRACWEALDVSSNLFLLFPEESKASIETRVSELIDRRLACLPCPSRCEARTFRLLQCSRTTTVLQGDRRLCLNTVKDGTDTVSSDKI